jgi:hypothetical protein
MPQHKERPASAQSSAAAAAAGPTVVPIRLQPGVDPLDGFNPEHEEPAPTEAPPPAVRSRAALAAAVAALVIAALALGVLYVRTRQGAGASSATVGTGRAILNSRPAGAQVFVDGVERGVAPLELDLPAGPHDVVFRSGTSERRLAIAVEAGTRTSENVDLPAAVSAPGQLEITSEPTGARVSIDGTPAGVTPLTLPGISPARHTIAVSQGSAVVNRIVEVSSGATASVFVSLGQAGGGAGWFAIDSPVELRILENGQLIGLSTAAPLMLPAGRHQFELVNEATELRVARTVQIEPGRPTRLSVPLPNGSLSMNASPWAEVFLDGRSLGVTPLGNVEVPIGRHELLWRHPQLGDKRSSVVVGAQTPARVSMDLSR